MLVIYKLIDVKKKKKTLSRTMRGHFLRKNFFLVFLFGSTKRTPKQYSALKQEDVLVRNDLPVVIRC